MTGVQTCALPILEIFDRENAYLSSWTDDMKMRFIFDSESHRQKEIDFGPPVGKEIL